MGLDKSSSPLLKKLELHKETEISCDDFNKFFENIEGDINIFKTEIKNAVNNFDNLIEYSKMQMNSIKKILETEKERQKDINILCNKYTNFSNVVLLDENNISSTLNYDNGIISLSTNKDTEVKYEVIDIIGNGYEGNKYVFNDNSFDIKLNDTSNRKYINDNDIITYYEYSRITASNSEKKYFSDVNFDSIYAKCSILLHSEIPFNYIEIKSELSDLILESLHISNDNRNYKQTSISDVCINNPMEKYNDKDYIYGSGLVTFNDSKYLKILLSCNSNTNDIIAFTNSVGDDEEVVKLNTAKRSVVKINNISLKQKKYSLNGTLMYKNFIEDKITSIAIFCNEYAPDDIDLRSSIKYVLNINGTDYEVIPINSKYDGKKIIRTTSIAVKTEYVYYINEEIKNATLTISMSTNKESVSPYISNLKILVGNK